MATQPGRKSQLGQSLLAPSTACREHGIGGKNSVVTLCNLTMTASGRRRRITTPSFCSVVSTWRHAKIGRRENITGRRGALCEYPQDPTKLDKPLFWLSDSSSTRSIYVRRVSTRRDTLDCPSVSPGYTQDFWVNLIIYTTSSYI